MSDNTLLNFYIKNNISPVKQNISNLAVHIKRREKLYRQLGIPTQLFGNSKILEIGPGSGYNTLAFFEWGGGINKKIDLIEPNKKGINDMSQLFLEHEIDKECYNIINCKIEEFTTNSKYDIIIAESFLPALVNKKEVIDNLIKLTNERGIIVITCIDEIGFFIEQMKRLIGHVLTSNIKDFSKKTEKLCEIFEPQLNLLQGVSRNVVDWVQDQLINPANNTSTLSLEEAIVYLGQEFDVLGSSPNLFVDYSWYKDIDFDYKKEYKKQFSIKRHNLLMCGLEETFLLPEENEYLLNNIRAIRQYAIDYERSYDKNNIKSIIYYLNNILHIMKRIDSKLYKVVIELNEILTTLLNKGDQLNIDLSKYKNFFSAFSRSQQYISFVKKGKYN